MCCGGGGGGQRPLEQEEKDLIKMQTQVAQQGMQGRTEAMGGFRDYVNRGKAMGSLANQEFEGRRAMTDAYSAYGNTQRMKDADLASMGVNPGDARFARGRDTAGVGIAGTAANSANAARAGVRQQGLSLESAGYSGLAGFDPTGALNSMGSTIANAQRTQAGMDASEAQGWGNLASAGMYGLKNGAAIKEGWNTFFGSDGGEVPSYADGGEVMGVQRYASGGNVYDSAMSSLQQTRDQFANRGAAPSSGGVNPLQAAHTAKMMVDMVSKKSGLEGTGANLSSMGGGQGLMPNSTALGAPAGPGNAGMGLQLPGANAGVGLRAPGGVMLDAAPEAGEAAAGLGEAGAGLGEAAGAGEAAAAVGAGEAAAGGAAASGMAALGTAVPILGAGLAIGALLDDEFASGGQVRSGIGGRRMAGRAQNPRGGKVSGPGGPKDDMVMARLSPGEFVMPVGAVKKFGLDRLEKMRQAGLEFEKQRNIH